MADRRVIPVFVPTPAALGEVLPSSLLDPIGEIRAVQELPAGENSVFHVLAATDVVVRWSPAERRTPTELKAELQMIEVIAGYGVATVTPVTHDIVGPVSLRGKPVLGVVFRWIENHAQPAIDATGSLEAWGALLARCHEASPASTDEIARQRFRWIDSGHFDVDRHLDSWDDATRSMIRDLLAALDAASSPNDILAHGDLTWDNILWPRNLPVAIDFDDACIAPVEFDIAACLTDLLVDQRSRLTRPPEDAIDRFMLGYTSADGEAPKPGKIDGFLWATLVERCITTHRTATPDPAAHQRLAAALQTGRLPPELGSRWLGLSDVWDFLAGPRPSHI